MDGLAVALPGDVFGKWQARGRLLQQWLDAPDGQPGVPACPFAPTNLTADDLPWQNPADTIFGGMVPIIEQEGANLGQLKPGNYHHVAVADTIPTVKAENAWEGVVDDGAIWIKNVFRTSGPPFSEVTRAIYEQYYSLRSLKFISAVIIVNTATEAFIWEKLYPVMPDPRPSPQEVFELGTPEYQALLGLPFGTLTASLLLTSFPRGTVRIPRIHVRIDLGISISMRFEIEHVLPKATRDLLAAAKADEAMLDVSDLSDAPADLPEMDLDDSSGLSDYPSSIDDYGPNGRKMTKKQGKRKAGESVDEDRKAKKKKAEAEAPKQYSKELRGRDVGYNL